MGQVFRKRPLDGWPEEPSPGRPQREPLSSCAPTGDGVAGSATQPGQSHTKAQQQPLPVSSSLGTPPGPSLPGPQRTQSHAGKCGIHRPPPPPPKKPDALSRQDVIQQSVHPVCAGHLLRCPALLRPRDAAASKAKLMTRALQSRRQTLFYKNHINTSLLRALSREKKGKEMT